MYFCHFNSTAWKLMKLWQKPVGREAKKKKESLWCHLTVTNTFRTELFSSSCCLQVVIASTFVVFSDCFSFSSSPQLHSCIRRQVQANVTQLQQDQQEIWKNDAKVNLSNWLDCTVSSAVYLDGQKAFSQRSLLTRSDDSLHNTET